jgi:hypothetical protein
MRQRDAVTLALPQARVRQKHSRTAQGWRLDETTVEYTFEDGTAEQAQRALARMMELVEEVALLGNAEAERRNRLP